MTLRTQAHHQALVNARQREVSPGYVASYAKRAGIEGTLSQGVRAFGLRRSRYEGLAKTHLQHVLTATAINLSRLSNWLTEQPRAQTRMTAFSRLLSQKLPAN